MRANDRLAALFGLSTGEVLGTGWMSAVHQDDGPRVIREWRTAASEGKPFRSEFRVKRAGLIRVVVEANEIPVESGERVWIGTVTDVSALAARERGLADEDAALKIASDNARDTQVLLAVEDGGSLRVDFVNERFMRLARRWRPGVSEHDLLGKSRDEVVRFLGFPEDLVREESAHYQRVLSERKAASIEGAVRTPEGETRYHSTTITPVLGGDGELSHVLWSSRDVTARRVADEARRVGDLAFEQSPEMLALMRVEPDGGLRHVRANRRYRAAVSRTRPAGDMPEIEGVLRDEWLAALGVPRDRVEEETERYREAIASGRPVSFELSLSGPSWRATIETVITPVMDDAGECTHVIWSGRDVTARREAERDLADSRESMNEAQAIAHIGSWTLDLVSGRLAWSDEIYRIFEIDPERFDASYEAFLNAIHPDDRELVDQAYTRSVELKQPYAIQHRLLMPDGRIKHVFERGRTQYAEDRTPLRSVGTVQDLTERILAVQRVEESEALFRATFEQAAVGMVLTDLRGNINLVNERFTEITGYSVEDLASRTLADLRVLSRGSDDAGAERAVFAGTLQSYTTERTIVHGDGTERWVNLTMSSRRHEGRPVQVLIVVEDITDRRRTAEALRRTEELARIGGWELDLTTGELRVSESARVVAGLDPGGPKVSSIGEMLAHIHPEDAARARSEVAQALENGASAMVECRVVAPAGTVRVIQMQAQAEPGVDGNPVMLRGYVQDVTERVFAEQEARESDLRLKAMLDQVPAIVWTTDTALRFTYVAGRPFVERGADIDGMMGRHLLDVWGDSDRNRRAVEYHQRALTGETVTYEGSNASGGRTFRTTLAPLRGAEGDIAGVLAVSFDVTDAVQAAEALQRSEESLLRAESLAKVGSWEWDVARGVVSWSPEAYRQFGLTPVEGGAPSIEMVRALIHPEDLPLMDAARARFGESGDSPAVEYRVNAADGETRYIRSQSQVMRGADGRLTGLYGYMQDITEQKAMEHELLLKDQAIASSLLGITFADFAGNLTFVNRAFLDMWGYEDDTEVLGRSALEFWQQPELAQKALEAVTTEGGTVGELVARRKDGSAFDAQFIAGVILDGCGNPLGLMGQFLDVSDRRQAESMLAESEELFRATFEQGAVGLVICDLEGRFLQVNERFSSICGYSAEELGAMHFGDITHPDDLRIDVDQYKRLLAGEIDGYQMEKRYLRRDRTVTWVNLSVSGLMRDGVLVQLMGAIEDITDRKAAEEALRRSEAALAEAERMAGIGSWEADLSTGEMRWSPEMYHRYGVTPEELGDLRVERARTLTESRVHPDDREAFRAWLGRLRPGAGMSPFEYRFLSPSGRYRVVRSAVEVATGTGGPTLRLRGFAQDITEQRTAADKIAQQLQEKEVLLREIHHRVKNNLQVVSSLLFLQQQRTESEEVLEVLRESSNRVAAMALVHEKLYSSDDLAVVEFRDYARDLAQSLFVSYGVDSSRIRMVVEGTGLVLPLDRAIPAALIVNETVSNALKHAFPGERRGQISIRVLEEESEDVIEIADDGVGIPPGHAQTAGTLGTRLIRRLASQMGAAIEQTGPGTVYRLTFSREAAE